MKWKDQTTMKGMKTMESQTSNSYGVSPLSDFLKTMGELVLNEYVPPDTITIDPLASSAAIAYRQGNQPLLIELRDQWKKKYPVRPFLPEEWADLVLGKNK